jgi:hypothetical protein
VLWEISPTASAVVEIFMRSLRDATRRVIREHRNRGLEATVLWEIGPTASAVVEMFMRSLRAALFVGTATVA